MFINFSEATHWARAVQSSRHDNSSGSRSNRPASHGARDRITLVTNVALPDMHRRRTNFVYTPQLGKTVNQMYHLMKAGQIQIMGTMVVFVLGNVQVAKYPHTVSANSIKNLMGQMCIMYPGVQVLISGALP